MKLADIKNDLLHILKFNDNSSHLYIRKEFPLLSLEDIYIPDFLDFCVVQAAEKSKDMNDLEVIEAGIFISKKEKILALGQLLNPTYKQNINKTEEFESLIQKILEQSAPHLCLLSALAFDPEQSQEKQWQPWGNAHIQIPQVLLQVKKQQLFLIIQTSKESRIKLKTYEYILNILENFLNIRRLSQKNCIKEKSLKKSAKSHYLAAVEKATLVMNNPKSDLQKVVLSEEFQYEDISENYLPSDFIKEQNDLYEGEQSFALIPNCLRQHTFFSGVSPETLYQKEGPLLMTEALAGTSSRKKSNETAANSEQEKALLLSKKDLDEHFYVRDFIVQALKKVSDDIRYIKHPKLRKLPHLSHLNTPIKVILNKHSTKSLLSLLHPTPAVCGFPRNAAQHFIHENESQPRGLYAGIFGYISPEKEHFCVNLRACYKHDNILSIFAGAGLVKNSVPESEWNEIQKKQSSVFQTRNK